MAEVNKYVSLERLAQYDGLIKNYIEKEGETALRSVTFADNTIKFYTQDMPVDDADPAFTIDMPTEYFLDQTKTVFEETFKFDAEKYTGAEDPGLDGKAVLVLAVKGDDGSIAYSFVSLNSLINTYIFNGSSSIAVTKAEGSDTYTFDVKLSTAENNAVVIKDDGIYVPDYMGEESDDASTNTINGLRNAITHIEEDIATESDIEDLFKS